MGSGQRSRNGRSATTNRTPRTAGLGGDGGPGGSRRGGGLRASGRRGPLPPRGRARRPGGPAEAVESGTDPDAAGKSDPGDALAIARVTAREADLPLIRVADRSLEISLLVEARVDLVTEVARVRNRLHADLRVFVPGYGERAARLRAVADEERAMAARIGAMVAGHPLLELPGAGSFATAKLLREIGDIGRFRSAD